jgi:hypothetical protein
VYGGYAIFTQRLDDPGIGTRDLAHYYMFANGAFLETGISQLESATSKV